MPKDITEIQMCFQKDVDELRSQVADLTRKLTEDNAISLQHMNENARSKERLQVAEQKLAEMEKV